MKMPGYKSEGTEVGGVSLLGAGFDPASRYDPTAMARIADPDSLEDDDDDNDLESVIGMQQMHGRFSPDRIILFVIGIGALVGTITALGASYRKDGEGAMGNNVQKAGVVEIPPAPQDIDTICSPNLLSTADGFATCESECDLGKCCHLPDEECRVSNPEMCSGYADCALVVDEATTPMSHPDAISSQVLTKCSVSSLTNMKGVNDCKEVCDPAMCCFVSSNSSPSQDTVAGNLNGLTSCLTAETFNWCSQYSACQSLHHVDENGFENKSEQVSAVEEACGSEHTVTCENMCKPAECCFDDEMDCVEMGLDMLVCDHYAPCSVVFGDLKTVGSPNNEALLDIAKEVSKACAEGQLDTVMGRSNCQHMCNYRGCCFEKNPVYNCVDEYKEECVAYASCKALLGLPTLQDADDPLDLEDNIVVSIEGPTDTIVDVEEVVTKACSVEALSNRDGIDNCHSICSPFLCCFSDSEEENCSADNSVDCEEHFACAALLKPAHLNISDLNLPSGSITTQTVKEACDPATIGTDDGLFSCFSVCADHLCCFVDKGMKSSCAEDEKCGTYDACHILVNEEDKDGDNDQSMVPTTPHEGLTLEETVVKELNAACSSEDPTELLKCNAICQTRECCFSAGVGSCYNTDKKYCDDFSVCNVLEKTSFQKEVIQAMCNEGLVNRRDGFADCHDLCSPFLCCFAGPDDKLKNCYNDHVEECDIHEGCVVLSSVSHEVEGEVTEEMITERCSIENLGSDEGFEACHSVCVDHLCCFVGDGMKSNCSGDEGSECKKYDACGILALTGDNKNAISVVDLNNVCSVDSLMNDKKHTQCEELCEARKCCFAAGPGSCYETDPEWCNEFDACKNLGKSITEIVGDNCRATTIASLDGMIHCNNICEPYLCCFSDDKEENCYDDHKAVCDMYADCEILVSPWDFDVTIPEKTTSVSQADVEQVCDACEGSSQCVKECHAICADHLCCFGAPGMKSNCQDTMPEGECLIYESCGVLVSETELPSVSQGVDESVSRVKEVCRIENFSNEGLRSECHNLCKTRDCCFTSGAGNCFETDKEWCLEFFACEILENLESNAVVVGTKPQG